MIVFQLDIQLFVAEWCAFNKAVKLQSLVISSSRQEIKWPEV